ncbi:hypothetical protein BXZ70DRAFT_994141 [Cristinia sonorae]|uniref:Uncharacterized protein n=1 Tax=Cristinia sonorae TaxID=1940300 RepID=A0A8K0UGW4_9AGAR|nr:hypothetical protein BXZ70DRAFT_994141 [Cristinia sonorae]
MEKSANVLAALDAGKIPSQQQISAFIDWLLNSALTQVEPSANSGELSEQGKILVGDVRNLLEAYKLVGEHKNGDNLIQEALWHLSQADISSTRVGGDFDTDQASKDARALAHALRTLLKLVWANFASESESVFHDFASFSRLALADAAEIVSKSAGSAAQSLREVDSEIEQGDRNELGISKKTDDEEPNDARAQFERTMDTVKVAGSKTIGAGQVAAQTAEDVTNRTTNRLQEAFYTICDRAQDNEEYHNSVTTIFDILGKWVHKSLDTAGDVNTDTSLESFIDDPTEEQHLIKAIRAVRAFAERMAGGKSLDDFFGVLRVCGVDIQQDQKLREFFDDLLAHLRKSVDERGYVRSDDAQKKREDLKSTWKELYDADTAEGQKWRDDVGKLQKEWEEFQKAFDSGEDTRRIQKAQSKLGSDIEQAMITAAGAGAQSAIDYAPWFWQDLFNAYIPRVLSIIKDIPIPRTEYSDDEVEFVLEDLDISSFNLLPGHAYIRNITDIDITAPVAGKSTTSVGSLTRIYVQALQLSLREVSFYYKDKTASMGPGEFTGILEFTLPPQGIDVDVVVRMIPNSPEGLKERERRGSFQEIQRVDVKVSDNIDLTVKQSNHSILATVFKPMILSRFRDTLQTVLAENIRGAIEWSDAFAWDVGNRAEVFADAGLSRGPSLVAGFWSELGHLRKGDTGFFKGWKATGTGMIKEEGNAKAGAKFAMGAEPQVLSGDKRGPKGTFSEPLADKAERKLDEMDVDVDASAETAKSKAKSVTAQAQETLKQGVQKIRSFKQTVADKAEEEKSRPGWKSDAFDVSA